MLHPVAYHRKMLKSSRYMAAPHRSPRERFRQYLHSGEASSNAGVKIVHERGSDLKVFRRTSAESPSKPSVATSGGVEVDTMVVNRVHDELEE